MSSRLLFIVLIFSSSCSKTVYENIWQSNPVKADGKTKEWTNPFNEYDIRTKLQYTVSNDKENLYLCFRVPGEQMQMKIIRAGIQLWIDTTGRNKKQACILFPASIMEKKEGFSPDAKAGQKHEKEGWKKKFLNEYKEMELAGFKSPIGGRMPLENNYGISFYINWDSTNIMVGEAVIPFNTFYKKSLSKSDISKELGLTLIINGLPGSREERGDQATGSQGAGMPGGGMGMQGGGMGGMGGGMPGGGIPTGRMSGGHSMGAEGSGSGELYEKNTIKLKIKLAVNNISQ